jgi:hypothetical protein
MYSKGYLDREEAVMRSSNPAKMEKTLVQGEKADIVQAPELVKSKRKR